MLTDTLMRGSHVPEGQVRASGDQLLSKLGINVRGNQDLKGLS